MGFYKGTKQLAAAVAIAGAAFLVAPAQAGVMSVTVWQGTNPGSSITDPMEQALPTNSLASTTPIAQFIYSGSLQWSQTIQALNTLSDFVGSGGGSVSGCVGPSCSGSNALQATLLSTAPFKLTTLFLIQFTTPSAMINASVRHDDGISIWDSTNTVSYLFQPIPTSAVTHNFSLPSAGTYNIWFVQANGAPTVLETRVADNSQVPEPGPLALIGASLLAMLGMMFLRKRAAAHG